MTVRVGAAAAAALLFGAAVFMAAHHPLWPAAAVLAVLVAALAETRRPGLWLFLLPAALPAMNFSPWTGWIVIDEFDIVVAAMLAGGHARHALAPPAAPHRAAPWRAAAAALAVMTLASFWRGLQDAGTPGPGWFASYVDPLNAWRIGKPLVYALLAIPLLSEALAGDRDRSLRRLFSGMVVGLVVVALAAAWERAAYPGLLDFAQPYRTVGLFWEMHVGGAAIDAYLAMAVPFAAWALLAARAPRHWWIAASLAVATAYVCLTTFSRGVYLAAAVGLAVLLGSWAVRHLRAWPAPVRWRRVAASCLALGLFCEAFLVLAPGSYMWSRLTRSSLDLDTRIEHWRHGIGLLETPADWLVGIGLGRLPARYAARVPQGEFSGQVAWRNVDGDGAARVWGPPQRRRLGGLYQLTQRVPLVDHYRVELTARAARPVSILLEVCERHLLYDARCEAGVARIAVPGGGWSTARFALSGPNLQLRASAIPRSGVLALSVLSADTAVDITRIRLSNAQGEQLLSNGDFADGLSHWLPSAQSYFKPWHIDNAFLELLIERGMLGLTAWLALVTLALRALLRTEAPSASFLSAALCGALSVGLVSSTFDVPRVAFLLYLLTFTGLVAAETASAMAMKEPAPHRGIGLLFRRLRHRQRGSQQETEPAADP